MFETDRRLFYARHLGETRAVAFTDAAAVELTLGQGAWLLHFGGTLSGTAWVRQSDGAPATAAPPSTPFVEGGLTSFETVVRFPPAGAGEQRGAGQVVSVIGAAGASGTLYATRISRGNR